MTLYESLRKSLADTVTMYFMAHASHWNVKGEDFPQMHAFFERIYEEVYGAVDPLAEHIRSIGGDAPSSLSMICSDSSIPEMAPGLNVVGMLRTLRNANTAVMASLTVAYEAATVAKNYGMQNFLADRLDQHSKHGWMLNATLTSLE